jgi:hypothetical protein
MAARALAAASAFGWPPSRQSVKKKSDCRTGFEKETWSQFNQHYLVTNSCVAKKIAIFLKNNL